MFTAPATFQGVDNIYVLRYFEPNLFRIFQDFEYLFLIVMY